MFNYADTLQTVSLISLGQPEEFAFNAVAVTEALRDLDGFTTVAELDNDVFWSIVEEVGF